MWYIIYNGRQVGPLDINQLPGYDLTPASMVWHEGMPDWQPAGNQPELQYLFSGGQSSENPKYAPGAEAYGNGYGPQNPYSGAYGQSGRYIGSGKKVAAGVLALLLGAFGIQYFYLGKVGAGFITILLTIVTCGLWEVITFIQGIVMLSMSDEDFDRKFVYTNATFPLF